MTDQTKKDIVDILLAIYGFPGQYFLGALILKAFYDAIKNSTPWSNILIIFIILFIVLEILTPIMAGERLIYKVKKNFEKVFGNKS